MSTASLVFDILARDKASSDFHRVGAAADRAGGHVSSFGSKLRTVAKYGALAAAAGAVLAVRWGVDAVKAAAADQQAQALLAKTLQTNAQASDAQVAAVEKWITKVGIATGVTDDQLRPALQRLVTATKDVGEAQRLASLAMDVSAGTGKSLEAVSTALMKAQNGQISGLSRLGVKTKTASGETMTLQQVTKSLADTYGGAAATKADTYQGKMDRLKLVYNETKETIGAKLLPVLTDLATWFLEKGIPAISKTWGWLKEKLGPVFEWVGGVIEKFRSKGDELASGAMPRIRSAIDAVKDALHDAGPFFDFVIGAGKELGEIWLSVMWPALKKVGEYALPMMEDHLRQVGKVLGAVGRAGIAMWNNFLAPAFKFFATAIGTILDSLGSMFGALSSLPGAPKWIGKTADALQHAADKAREVADNIDRIDTDKTVNIHVVTTHANLYQGAANAGDPDISRGTAPRRGGRPAPRAAGRMSGRSSVGDVSVDAIAAAMRAALDGLVVGINDDGTATFRLTGESYS